MNENISSGFNETIVLKIFCDTCEAIALLHHNDNPVLHRDLKVKYFQNFFLSSVKIKIYSSSVWGRDSLCC